MSYEDTYHFEYLSDNLPKICLCFNVNVFFQNIEAEKQLKFFQGCVAAAFAERDNALMEVMVIIFLFLDYSFDVMISDCKDTEHE